MTTYDQVLEYIRGRGPDFMNAVRVVEEHQLNAKAAYDTPVYGTTMPDSWYLLLRNYADMQAIKMPSMVTRAINDIMSPDAQVEKAAEEGVAVSEIRRRLIKQAFPWLPDWKWKVARPIKSTPKPGEQKLTRTEERELLKKIVTTKLAGTVEFVLPLDVYDYLMDRGMEKGMTAAELIKETIIKNARQKMEATNAEG